MDKEKEKPFKIKEFIKYSVNDLMIVQILDKNQIKLMKKILCSEFLL